MAEKASTKFAPCIGSAIYRNDEDNTVKFCPHFRARYRQKRTTYVYYTQEYSVWAKTAGCRSSRNAI